MKLEVRMYVRTKEGYICRVLKLKEEINDDGYLDFNDIGSPSIQKKNVIKASHNIIDLIEVGDYVNGYLIDYIDSERRFLRSERPYRVNSSWYKCLIEKGKDYNMCLHFKEEDIKSIVTKEQFEAMAYKVV